MHRLLRTRRASASGVRRAGARLFGRPPALLGMRPFSQPAREGCDTPGCSLLYGHAGVHFIARKRRPPDVLDPAGALPGQLVSLSVTPSREHMAYTLLWSTFECAVRFSASVSSPRSALGSSRCACPKGRQVWYGPEAAPRRGHAEAEAAASRRGRPRQCRCRRGGRAELPPPWQAGGRCLLRRARGAICAASRLPCRGTAAGRAAHLR